ncbi:MAG: hypothetical protein RAP03_05135, partial [Candidatus Electryonea clarkiae]|nr:hypothetical protein [Candidatus Electryonea clarkiae]
SSIVGIQEILKDDGFLAARTKCRDPHGFESDWNDFETTFINFENDVPGAPSLTSPRDERLIETRPNFKWTEARDEDHSDPSSTLRYGIHVALEDSPEKSVPFGTDTVKAVTNWTPKKALPDNSKLIWKMRTIDDDGAASEWSQAFHFSIDKKPQPPEPFELSSPVDQASIDPNKPIEFKWEDAVDLDLDSHVRYKLLIGDREFGPFDETTYTLQQGLQAGKHKWRIVAVDETGLTKKSKQFKLTVGE